MSGTAQMLFFDGRVAAARRKRRNPAWPDTRETVASALFSGLYSDFVILA
jgi:prepilin-type processing-associated H-X9-DG protein